MNTDKILTEIKDANNPIRPGRILTDTVYGSWCDICDDHLGDFPSYQEASIALTEHLNAKHYGWNHFPESSKTGKEAQSFQSQGCSGGCA